MRLIFQQSLRRSWQKLRVCFPRLSSHRFAIASALLGDPELLAWSNLGFWQNTDDDQNTDDYQVACAQLAEQVGLAAKLKPHDHVLDLGCGQGASLKYWINCFGIQHLSAFEIQSACIARIQAAHLRQLDGLYQAAFDQLPLPSNKLYGAFDAVLCVDAAYHARLTDFVGVNRAVLKPHGRIAFTTLGKSKRWPLASLWLTTMTLRLLSMAYVPPQNLLYHEEIITTLQQAGFTDIHLQVLNQEVLAGFACYIDQREPPKSSSLAVAADWLKISLTARLCDFLAKHGLVHYLLVSARLA